LIREIETEPSKTPKPCLALRFVVAMDFQVVVLGGGVSKKLLPLVSQVPNGNASNIQFSTLLCYMKRLFLSAGASERVASGGESPRYLLRSRVLGA